MVKTTQKSDQPWSGIFSVIVYWGIPPSAESSIDVMIPKLAVPIVITKECEKFSSLLFMNKPVCLMEKNELFWQLTDSQLIKQIENSNKGLFYVRHMDNSDKFQN